LIGQTLSHFTIAGGNFQLGLSDQLVDAQWDEDQIKLFALVALVASTSWFVLGLFRPEARLF
jgi:hypothetical protein